MPAETVTKLVESGVLGALVVIEGLALAGGWRFYEKRIAQIGQQANEEVTRCRDETKAFLTKLTDRFLEAQNANNALQYGVMQQAGIVNSQEAKR